MLERANVPVAASLARRARRDVRSLAPPPLAAALIRLEAECGGEPADFLWTAAAAGTALWLALAQAQGGSGRSVIETIFALHALLRGENRPDTMDEAVRERIAPYRDWLAGLAAQDPVWRARLMQWIEVFGQRLTLHRYATAAQRQGQALALLAGPVAAALGRTPDRAFMEPLQVIAERALRFWDLMCAEPQRQHGWNRIEIGEDAALGGFYGLADQARIPSPESVRVAAAQLRSELQAAPDPADDPQARWLAGLNQAMRAALEQFERDGTWPLAAAPSPRLLARLGGWLRRR